VLREAQGRERGRTAIIIVQERRRRGQRSLTNIIRIVSREWRDWLRKGPSRSAIGVGSNRQQGAGRTRFLLLPLLSAAELEAEREGERKLNAVLTEIFGPKESYGDSEVDAACALLDAREKAND
jgi:hypothetical protein